MFYSAKQFFLDNKLTQFIRDPQSKVIIAQETLFYFCFDFSMSEEFYQEQMFGIAPGNQKCQIL